MKSPLNIMRILKNEETVLKIQFFILAVLFIVVSICIFLLPGCSKKNSMIPAITLEEKMEQKTIGYPGIISVADNGVFVRVDFVKLYNPQNGEVFENGTIKFYPASEADKVTLKRYYCPYQCSYNQNFTTVTLNNGYVKINGVKHNTINWDATN